MRTCPRCSLANPDSAIVCDCGNLLDPDAASSLPAAALQPPTEPAPRNGAGPSLLSKVLVGAGGYFAAAMLFALIRAAMQPEVSFPPGLGAVAGLAGVVIALGMLDDQDARATGRRPETRRRNYFARHWRGELSLGVSYWLNGWFVGFASIFTIAVVNELGRHCASPYAPFFFGVAGWILMAAGEVWYFVGTWRSADRPTPGGWISSWSGPAKVALVIGATLTVAFAVANGGPALRAALEQAQEAARSSRSAS